MLPKYVIALFVFCHGLLSWQSLVASAPSSVPDDAELDVLHPQQNGGVKNECALEVACQVVYSNGEVDPLLLLTAAFAGEALVIHDDNNDDPSSASISSSSRVKRDQHGKLERKLIFHRQQKTGEITVTDGYSVAAKPGFIITIAIRPNNTNTASATSSSSSDDEEGGGATRMPKTLEVKVLPSRRNNGVQAIDLVPTSDDDGDGANQTVLLVVKVKPVQHGSSSESQEDENSPNGDRVGRTRVATASDEEDDSRKGRSRMKLMAINGREQRDERRDDEERRGRRSDSDEGSSSADNAGSTEETSHKRLLLGLLSNLETAIVSLNNNLDEKKRERKAASAAKPASKDGFSNEESLPISTNTADGISSQSMNNNKQLARMDRDLSSEEFTPAGSDSEENNNGGVLFFDDYEQEFSDPPVSEPIITAFSSSEETQKAVTSIRDRLQTEKRQQQVLKKPPAAAAPPVRPRRRRRRPPARRKITRIVVDRVREREKTLDIFKGNSRGPTRRRRRNRNGTRDRGRGGADGDGDGRRSSNRLMRGADGMLSALSDRRPGLTRALRGLMRDL